VLDLSGEIGGEVRGSSGVLATAYVPRHDERNRCGKDRGCAG
jgi:hypothetical protein